MEVLVKYAESEKELEDVQYVRTEVHVKEQGFNVPGSFDETCIHVIAYVIKKDEGSESTTQIPVGSLRFFKKDDDKFKIGRVAVLSSYRGLSIGKKMMVFVEEQVFGNKREEFEKVNQLVLSSQYGRHGFYIKLGYYTVGEVYNEDNYPHIYMIKDRVPQ
ncbi:hypothetical protein BB559_001517 [Furculomyces boomerangus]|uniref:N-acetyltransferase domain-containing protein n=2 Tax=Harpellales TaxID=61421 RepID=A0A2T9XX29_9FUNG|nr:hypothetical protein BB559_007526 [Furculomyces boomerangus]PVU98503.1 hypothetical protein BB559_001517 [Furculomyces boomerangus]PVZ98908.1 hypothetical protein BB558_005082 [Smittium angustum]